MYESCRVHRKWKVAMQDAFDLARQNISKSADDDDDWKVRFE